MSEVPTEGSIKIEFDSTTQAYFKGVGAGEDVAQDLEQVPDHTYPERLQFFWLSVGTKLASSGIDGNDQEAVVAFVRGAKQRAPERTRLMEMLDRLDETAEGEDVDEFYNRSHQLTSALRRNEV